MSEMEECVSIPLSFLIAIAVTIIFIPLAFVYGKIATVVLVPIIVMFLIENGFGRTTITIVKNND